jgi:predicted phage gp36 major capsid-like protein
LWLFGAPAGQTSQPGLLRGWRRLAGSVVSPVTPEVFAAADVYAVQNALPPRFQPRAVWNANLSILNSARQMESTNAPAFSRSCP